MSPLTAINAVANTVVALAVLDLALRIFGRPDHPIHNYPAALVARKLVSSIVVCGAVLNVATLSTPSWTEVLLNVGFSLNYLWSSYYDRLPKKEVKAKPSITRKPITRRR